MASQEHNIPTEPIQVQSEPVVQLLGSDPWMRFDLWANRAWEATERAVNIAADSSAISDDVDHRALALFHAAQIAKEFAEMVNPIFALAPCSNPSSKTSAEQVETIMTMLLEEGD